MATRLPQDQFRPHYVYRCYDATGDLLYVGCTVNPVARIEGHRAAAWWWPQVDHVRNLVFPDRSTALEKERAAIFNEMPKCNVKGRWYKQDSRTNWGAGDYLDFRLAVVRSVESTHGMFGIHTRRTLAEVDAELLQRFSVSHLDARRSA